MSVSLAGPATLQTTRGPGSWGPAGGLLLSAPSLVCIRSGRCLHPHPTDCSTMRLPLMHPPAECLPAARQAQHCFVDFCPEACNQRWSPCQRTIVGCPCNNRDCLCSIMQKQYQRCCHHLPVKCEQYWSAQPGLLEVMLSLRLIFIVLRTC